MGSPDTSHRRLLTFLRDNPGRWFTVNELARGCRVGETDWHKTCPNTRKLIRELIDAGHPVLSGSRGYRLAEYQSEIATTASELERRAQSILDRAKALRRSNVADSAYFIDGNGMIHRAIHAGGQRLTGPDGKPTAGAFFFTKTLLKFLRTYRPKVLAFALDERRDQTFRRHLYPAYKAHRGTPDEDVIHEIRTCIKIVKVLGIPTVKLSQMEADDIVVSLSDIYRATHQCVIVGTDKDLDQAIRNRKKGYPVHRLDPYLAKTITYSDVCDKYGFAPHKLPTYQAMVGDTADNVPGIRGIGEKTAKLILRDCPSWKAIVKEAKKGSWGTAVNARIVLAEEDGTYELMRTLVTLKRDLDFPADTDLEFNGPNMTKARKLFGALGFRRWE